jgi:murein DD-endopeptidase MepM/ murein hydrolase activator NlpD
MKKKILFSLLLIIVAAISYFIGYDNGQDEYEIITEELLESDSTSIYRPQIESQFLFGINIDSLDVIEDIIKPRQNLSSILLPYNISYVQIDALIKASKGIFDLRRIAAQKKYTILCEKDSLQAAKYFIYEPSQLEFIIFYITDSISVRKFEKEVEIKEKSISGIISSSLYETMIEAGASPALANNLSEVFAWQIDFFRIQKGDKFKVIYEDKLVDGVSVGVGEILGAYFEHFKSDYYAIPFDQGNGVEYFDEKGGSLRKAFLKAPLNYTRISSRFSLKRFHPVQQRFKAHLGTDYAAPAGTPIMTVGDGIVVEASHSQFNGNYVKVKHNGTYTTQYLHMSKIASGIKNGAKVRQGQVIGYVGSTGLATGPHLCFRFWENGKQVDALRVKIPASHPVNAEKLNDFNEAKVEIIEKLNIISFPAAKKSVSKK